MNKTVYEIVKEYLLDNGYDGLFNLDVPCGCEVGQLAPCDEMNMECEAGYKVPGCSPNCGNGCNWHIAPNKPRRPTS